MPSAARRPGGCSELALSAGTSTCGLRLLHVRRLDVGVDELLKFGRQLVVGAAKSFDVVTVDVNRAARLLAGAGQTDADAGGLRFAGTVDDAAHDSERHRLDAFVGRLPRRHHLANVILN